MSLHHPQWSLLSGVSLEQHLGSSSLMKKWLVRQGFVRGPAFSKAGAQPGVPVTVVRLET